MKMFTKSIKMAALLFVAAIGLMACKKDNTDVFAVNSGLSQKTLLGMYSYVGVDSENMNTVITEWSLENGAEGRTGYKKVASTGNGEDADALVSLTWSEATMTDDYLGMKIPVVVNGESKELLWRNGVIEVDGYVTTKSVISMTDILRSVNDNFANLDFVYSDTTYCMTIKPDTSYYLSWETKVVEYTQTEIDNYKAYLLTMVDTIAWFNATFSPESRGATTEIPDTVKFSTKQTSGGKYKGLIPFASEAMMIRQDTTIHGPSQIINSEMVFNRANKQNTGSYEYHLRTWSDEFYLNPTTDKAVSYDSLYQVVDAKWTPSAFTNVKKFEVLLKGNEQVKVSSTKAGAGTQNIDKTTPNALHTVALSGFNNADGEITANEHKYKTK